MPEGVPTLPESREMLLPSALSAVLWIQHRQQWHPDGREEGGCHQELANTLYSQRTPTLPWFCQVLYRRFIQDYSTISSPLTSLLRNKPKSLTWTPAATNAFHILKEAFTTAPLLVHPNPDKPFVVEVDASTTRVGAVLSQQQGNPSRLHPCAFFFWRKPCPPPMPPPTLRRVARQACSISPGHSALHSSTLPTRH